MNTKRENPAPPPPKATAKEPRVGVRIRQIPNPRGGKDVPIVASVHLWDPQEYTVDLAGQPISKTRAPDLRGAQIVEVPRHIAEKWLRNPELRKVLEIVFEPATRPVVFDTPQEGQACRDDTRFGRSLEGRALRDQVAEKLAAGNYPDWPAEGEEILDTKLKPVPQVRTGSDVRG